jgi:two-component system NtrC family sensor kinase
VARRLSLRWQIVLSLLLLMLVTVVLVSVAVVGMTRGALERQALNYTERLAFLAATTMSSALEPSEALDVGENRASLQRLCELFAAQPAGTALFVVDRRLDHVASWPERPDGPAASELAEAIRSASSLSRFRGELATRVVDSYAPIRLEGVVVGAIHVQMPMHELPTLLDRSGRVVVSYLIIDALLVLVLGYWLLTRLIARPLDRLSAATERVARGDLSVRVDPLSGTELLDLAAHFNNMVTRLRENRVELETRLDELRRANDDLARAQSEVVRSERLATVGTLAAGIAHEVGNPLSAVLGLVALLEEPDLLDENERADTLKRVTRELHRIDGIIRGLLEFARAGESRSASCDAHEVVETVTRLCQHHQRGRDTEVVTTFGESLPKVAANESHMVQVMLNLMLNAVDAMSGRGIVRVDVRAESGGVVFSVEDNGPGIDSSLRARIFDPFFTTKPPGLGTGLGLAIVERLVSQWHGKIEVQSEPGKGTRFAVWIPASADTGD